MHSFPKVAVIIPFFNGDHLIQNCVASILKSKNPVTNIYIIDNSTKPTQVKAFFSSTSLVKIITAKPAIGFGRACNIGLKRAISDKNDVGIIMNQDAIFEKETIGLLAQYATLENTFGTVPISYSYDLQTIHPKVFTGYLKPVEGFLADKADNKLKDTYKLSYLQANGSCVAFNLKAIKNLPWFDPIFKMYGEDVELFDRMITKENLSFFLVPKAHIGHIHSQLSNKEGKNKINAYGRHGGQVMHLKKNQNLKFIIKTFHTYALALKKLNFKLIWLYLISDIQLIPKIGLIRKSREKHFLLQQIEYYLDHDQTK